MSEPASQPDSSAADALSLWHVLWAIPGGGLLYVLAMLVLMSSVPRVAEGGRQIVDWPWQLYASLPSIVAGVVGLATILLAVRSMHLRMGLLLVFAATLAAVSLFGIELLRRDFIGKL